LSSSSSSLTKLQIAYICEPHKLRTIIIIIIKVQRIIIQYITRVRVTSKYIIVCILYYYILHTIYNIILFARRPSRVLRLFLFPFGPVICHDPCSVRLEAFFRKRNFFSPSLSISLFLSLSLSLTLFLTRPCRLRFNTIIFILSHCFDDRERARASRNLRTPAYGTDSWGRRTRATLYTTLYT